MDPSLRGRIPQPTYNRGGRFRLNRRTVLVIGGILLAIIIGFVLLSNSGDKSGPLQQRLSARLSTLNRLVADGKKNLSSAELRELNGRLSIQLANDRRAIGAAMTAKAAPANIVSAEADTASFKSLETARLNNRYDETYQKLVAQKLDSTTALIKELYNTTRSTPMKKALEDSYKSLEQLETQFMPQSS